MPKLITNLVQVSIGGKGCYTYSYKGMTLKEGDTVVVPVRNSNQQGKVLKLGSDYKGAVKEVICKVDQPHTDWVMAGTSTLRDEEERTSKIESLSAQIAELEASEEQNPTLSSATSLSMDHADSVSRGTTSTYQGAHIQNSPPHIIVKALAGTGKTTTVIEGCKNLLGLPTRITPSAQQQAIWDAMMLSKGVKTICLTSLTNTIVGELKRRVPAGVEAIGMHSMGYRAIRQAFRLLPGDQAINKFRVSDILVELLGGDIWHLRREKPITVKAVTDLVGKCKVNLTPLGGIGEQDNLQRLADHHQIDLGGNKERDEIFALVPRVLERCKDVAKDQCIDFNDQIWLPIVLNLPMFQYDFIIGDEAQDFNRAQQEIIKRVGKRIMLVGDEHQAIFGFTGADVESMRRMEKELAFQGKGGNNMAVALGEPGCVILPLTITRRCGRAIVNEAKRIVPEFEAHESNCEGSVDEALYPLQGGGWGDQRGERRPTYEIPLEESYVPMVKEGDFVICPRNAPLVKEFFRFIKLGLKAFIVGREFGQQMVNLVNSLEARTIPELVEALDRWLDAERAKENARKHPDEAILENLNDKHGAVSYFISETKAQGTVQSIIVAIEQAFDLKGQSKDEDKDRPGIRLSSIHKAKGLESKSIFILEPVALNCSIIRMDKKAKPWEVTQSRNLKYVGITRAIESLVWVY